MSAPIMLVVDLSNLIARAFFSVPEQQRNLGLCRHRVKQMVGTLIRETQPRRLVGCIDSGATFRHELFPDYKAHRGEKDDVHAKLRAEAPEVLVREFGMEIYSSPGFEADDAIATISARCFGGPWRLLICSNDLDLAALVYRAEDGAGVYLLRFDSGQYHVFGPEQVEQRLKMKVPPRHVALYKALAGDASDGIPGCHKIGPVAARRLCEWGSIQRIFENLPKLQNSDRSKLEAAGRDHMMLMQQLTTLRHDAPLQKFQLPASR